MYAVELFTHESESESESERDPSEAFRDVTVDPIWPPQQSAKAKKKATLQFSMYPKIFSSQINWPGDNISFNLWIICSL